MENILLVFIVAALTYVTILLWPERIVFTKQNITKKAWFKPESFPLADLSEIHFHYHAVVGFECQWEFISVQGQNLTLNSMGLSRRFVHDIEHYVPRFSAADFYKEFDQGDIEDSLVVWQLSSVKQV